MLNPLFEMNMNGRATSDEGIHKLTVTGDINKKSLKAEVAVDQNNPSVDMKITTDPGRISFFIWKDGVTLSLHFIPFLTGYSWSMYLTFLKIPSQITEIPLKNVQIKFY